MIGRAAHEVGMADLTVKRVADHLGVSVAGLYHHVEGRDDLLRLAAEYSATRLPAPADRGQHWALWLLEWANHNRDAFVSEPGLLGQYLDGAISTEAIADNVDAILGVLVRQGFSIHEARAAYDLVSVCAVGSAVAEIREKSAADAGRPLAADHLRVLAQRDPDDLPYLRQLSADIGTRRPEPLLARITTVLVGIAVGRGEPPAPIVEAIEAATGRSTTLS